MANQSLFAHLTFGLLDGWWLYEDREWRIPGSPGLFQESWQKILENEGFASIRFLQGTNSLGQQSILALSDGVVRRQQFSPKPPSIPIKNKEIKMQFQTQNGLLKEKGNGYFIELIGEVLKIPAHKIDASEPLEKYGIDSLVIVQLTNRLQAVLNDVSITLFFEYQTIDALVDYFIKTQKDVLAKLVGIEVTPVINSALEKTECSTSKNKTENRAAILKDMSLNQQPLLQNIEILPSAEGISPSLG